MYVMLHNLSAQFIRKVGVLGAGQMGTGIAKVMITTAKIPVQLFDSRVENAKKAEVFVRMFVIAFRRCPAHC